MYKTTKKLKNVTYITTYITTYNTTVDKGNKKSFFV